MMAIPHIYAILMAAVYVILMAIDYAILLATTYRRPILPIMIILVRMKIKMTLLSFSSSY